MSEQSLRSELDRLEGDGSLLRMGFPVPLDAIAGLLAYTDGGPALFANVEGFKHPVVGNICNGRPRMAAALDIPEAELTSTISHSVGAAIDPVVVTSAPCQERSGPVDLLALPIPRFFETRNRGLHYRRRYRRASSGNRRSELFLRPLEGTWVLTCHARRVLRITTSDGS